MNYIDLNALLEGAADLPRSTTVLREVGLRCVVLHLKAGEQIPVHEAKGAITVHCLSGELDFSAAEEHVHLRAGGLLILPAEVAHSLAAIHRSIVLVTMADGAQPR